MEVLPKNGVTEPWNNPVFDELFPKAEDQRMKNSLREVLYWSPRLPDANSVAQHLSLSLQTLEKLIDELRDLGFNEFSHFDANSKLIQEWKYPLFGSDSIARVWQDAVSEFADGPYIIDEVEGELSYAEANQIIEKIMSRLLGSGIKKGEYVAICAPANIESLIFG